MTTATFALPARTLDERAGAFAGRGWRAYLVAAALLLPFALPSGPAQLAALDLVNLGALAVFAAVVMLRRVPVVVPFAVPLIVIGAASLLAVTNARSVGASALSLAQDAYLVAWFVLLVAVMSRQGNLRPVALAWVVVSDLAALVCIAQAAQAGAFPGQLLSAEGFRPAGTFYGANMASIALLVVALLVTKSNGSLIALVIGLAASGIVWAMRGEGARLRRLGGLALLAAVVVLGSFAAIEWGALGDARRIGEAGMLGRMEKSSTSRQAIWSQLAGRLVRNPLGIGPGNSVHQSVAIGYRVRPSASFQSKEAHSDYIAYAVERGPLGLVGHLLWVAAGLALVLGGRGPAPRLEWLRAAFAGGLVATAVHSAVIEKLHFRHYWLFLALACATMAASRFRPEHPAEARP
jgi:hypothetical protein